MNMKVTTSATRKKLHAFVATAVRATQNHATAYIDNPLDQEHFQDLYHPVHQIQMHVLYLQLNDVVLLMILCQCQLMLREIATIQ